ncbi:MAG: hypothetical protein KVP17_002539 [Porospora cf. gigantea B]|uniref:uncharacterized protein n=2 Tax=Porospora cf. gigantea B TaxID=2853592 RepID=UPI003571A726|nr:MAG: hypothetical protein KVP17_002539 [Porospora cf. gigantea B]
MRRSTVDLLGDVQSRSVLGHSSGFMNRHVNIYCRGETADNMLLYCIHSPEMPSFKETSQVVVPEDTELSDDYAELFVLKRAMSKLAEVQFRSTFTLHTRSEYAAHWSRDSSTERAMSECVGPAMTDRGWRTANETPIGNKGLILSCRYLMKMMPRGRVELATPERPASLKCVLTPEVPDDSFFLESADLEPVRLVVLKSGQRVQLRMYDSDRSLISQQLIAGKEVMELLMLKGLISGLRAVHDFLSRRKQFQHVEVFIDDHQLLTVLHVLRRDGSLPTNIGVPYLMSAEGVEACLSFSRLMSAFPHLTLELRPSDYLLFQLSGCQNSECSICLSLIQHDSNVTHCGHVFHNACLGQVLSLQRSSAKCPLCRATLTANELQVFGS